ncbi:hypothetical protein L6452_07397 [Arctium lappa]|uniref:Uncharacterized protein n=1 Tax=Arctium lappa TaxID=4217 RepID=A0ACB9EKR5_ARCLA|nr:hypothetical protein L6452_07397 [Arctium lappa]
MGFFSEVQELKLENTNLQSSLTFYVNRANQYADENNSLKEEVSALKTINEDLLTKTSGLNDEKTLRLESENSELKRKISDLEQKIAKDKSDFENKEKSFANKFSDFSRKCADEKKEVELKCIKLSQQVSAFEKVIILEREKFEKEKKAMKQKNVGFFKEISDQRNDAEKRFEEKRSMFEAEIKKLTAKLSELSEKALKEQKTKNIDGSGTHPRRRRYKVEELVWKKKPVKDELKERESCVHAVNAKKNNASKSKPDHIYSRDQLLRQSRDQRDVDAVSVFKDEDFKDYIDSFPYHVVSATSLLQPNIVNDNRRRRDRFEGPDMEPCNGNHNRVDLSSSKSKKEEEEEKIHIILQRILLSSKEESQHEDLFRSHCSVHKKVCNLIIDNGSCENLVSQKLVDYFNLPTQHHECPYSLGWIKNGFQVRVTQTCRVTISIGKHYREEVLCDVLDMDACHILLGRPWQFDNHATYKRRYDLVLFRCGDQKIVVIPVDSFDAGTNKKSNINNRTIGSVTSLVRQPPIPEEPSKQDDEVLPNKVEDEVVTESQQEIVIEAKVSELDLGPVTEDTENKIVEDILEPTKALSQEVKKDFVFVVPTSKAPVQTETIPGTVTLISYPFEFDKISLVWRRSRQTLLGFEEWSYFSNFGSQVVNQSVRNKRMIYGSDEGVFQVNSRTSSFQVRVTDTGRIREVIRIFENNWKRRKRARKRLRNWNRKRGKQKLPRAVPGCFRFKASPGLLPGWGYIGFAPGLGYTEFASRFGDFPGLLPGSLPGSSARL